jgi:hypothetical protein
MVSYVGVSTQLNLFDKHVTILRENNILKNRFQTSDFYEYQPHHKSGTFKGFPYIIISLPRMDEEKLDLKRRLMNKTLVQEIRLHTEYDARDKVRHYANEIISQIESNKDSYRIDGFDEVSIQLVDSLPVVLNSKDLIETTFEFTCEIIVSTP